MKFVRMRPQGQRPQFFFTFPFDPHLDKVVCENITGSEKLVVFFKCVNCLGKGTGRFGTFAQRFRCHLVDVPV